LEGDWVAVESRAAISAQKIIECGVRDSPAVDALAALSRRKLDVLVWNYHDDDIDRSNADIDLRMTGLPRSIRTLHLRYYRIDGEHSNSYTTWKRLGSPQQPTTAQYSEMENAGQLQLLEAPRRIEVRNGIADLQFSLPAQALSLLELAW
jgi:xylan 1,4-beta-xylosidase